MSSEQKKKDLSPEETRDGVDDLKTLFNIIDYSRLMAIVGDETQLLNGVASELQKKFDRCQNSYFFLYLKKVSDNTSQFSRTWFVPHVYHPDTHDWNNQLTKPGIAVVFNVSYNEFICCGHFASIRARVDKNKIEIRSICRNDDLIREFDCDPLELRLHNYKKDFNSVKRRAVA